MATSNAQGGGGIGFVGVLTIVFVVLQLTHVIRWSWWWVLSPLWISFGLWLLVVGVAFGIMAFIRSLDSAEDRKRRAAADALDAYRKSLR